MNVQSIRETTDEKLAGSLRLLLAVLFVMTGMMKLVVPMIAICVYLLWRGGGAWSNDLIATIQGRQG